MQIELLYFDGCPHWERALEELKKFLSVKHDTSSVTLGRIGSEAEAERRRFTGSPTIRFEGRDILPSEGEASYGFGCRVYPAPHGFQGWPTSEILEAAYQKALSSRGRPGADS